MAAAEFRRLLDCRTRSRSSTRLKRSPELKPVLATIICLATAAAFAQRADENAVTAAQDAFGTSIGFQNVGLYSPVDARGFNPQQAGNLRIEGLYFDQQTWVSGDCMVRETTMRVGIAAQSYSFPAPTGIADLSLRTPGDKTLVSAILTRGPFDAATADLEAQLPLIEGKFGVDLCAGYRRNFDVDLFRESYADVFGTTFRWHPTANTEVIPFWSFVGGRARQIVPNVYTDGTLALPQFRTQDLGVQDWTTWGWNQTTFGVVVKSALGEHWTLAAGLFHSLERDPLTYQPYLTLVTPRTADSVMDVAPPFRAESTSGELRLSRAFTNGAPGPAAPGTRTFESRQHPPARSGADIRGSLARRGFVRGRSAERSLPAQCPDAFRDGRYRPHGPLAAESATGT
jgi:iron complex outermembrane receptor protein